LKLSRITSESHAPTSLAFAVGLLRKICGKSCKYGKKYLSLHRENRKIMAKPIEPTPVLKGDDAYEFVAEMEKQEKASAEEKARVAKGASFIQSLLTFTF
jgi:hypothetical protein